MTHQSQWRWNSHQVCQATAVRVTQQTTVPHWNCPSLLKSGQEISTTAGQMPDITTLLCYWRSTIWLPSCCFENQEENCLLRAHLANQSYIQGGLHSHYVSHRSVARGRVLVVSFSIFWGFWIKRTDDKTPRANSPFPGSHSSKSSSSLEHSAEATKRSSAFWRKRYKK